MSGRALDLRSRWFDVTETWLASKKHQINSNKQTQNVVTSFCYNVLSMFMTYLLLI